MVKKNREIIEFGDFQTPVALTNLIADMISPTMDQISTIIEPNCGTGNFLKAFARSPKKAMKLIGWEINPRYVNQAREELFVYQNNGSDISIIEQDFFQIDWDFVKTTYKKPTLFIGNPPWVTSSELSKIKSKNIPIKTNFQNHSGFEALTGKSNFDISEWMLIKIAEYISNSQSAMSFLIKTSVARKVFLHIKKKRLYITDISIREIDVKKYFNVTVDGCLFTSRGCTRPPNEYTCPIYNDLSSHSPYKTMGIYNNNIIADLSGFSPLLDIDTGCEFKWRSGIKHDASKVMEFKETKRGFVNGLGEITKLPKTFLYPMYKSSNISKKVLNNPEKWMLVTQEKIGDDTNNIINRSPETWAYLEKYNNILNSRKSSIYKNAPKYSIFGVGEYSFKPWKVVISGLYKNLKFSVIHLYKEKPIVLDDTCYMLGFNQKEEADFIFKLLKSNIAQKFILSLVFKDNKRPITIGILNRINMRALARRLEKENDFDRIFFKETPKLISKMI